jgi:anti-anti-sigma regulatory factor
MLRISATATTDEQPALLRLAGHVSGPWVEELRRACGQILGTNGSHSNRLVLDLAEVSFIDADGVTLFQELTARRVLVTNCSPFVAEQLKGVANVDR